MERKNVRAQGGFTLIEIIAVLVILGILAVVALPKYTDMQNEARIQVSKGIVAAAQGQLSMDYAQSLLNTNVTFGYTASCNNVAISDSAYTLSCASGVNGIKVNYSNSTIAQGTWNTP